MSAVSGQSDKQKSLSAKMARLGIREEDIVEKFVNSSGPGGQHVNKTASCVYLKHIPTDVEVKCQTQRSQALNRFLARSLLAQKIERKAFLALAGKRQQIEKIKRQNRRRSLRAKRKIAQEKHERSEKKGLRRKIRDVSALE
ncbi:MAG: peptide chain release factor-like protein [Candidatus Omnitrophota bacterium]